MWASLHKNLLLLLHQVRADIFAATEVGQGTSWNPHDTDIVRGWMAEGKQRQEWQSCGPIGKSPVAAVVVGWDGVHFCGTRGQGQQQSLPLRTHPDAALLARHPRESSCDERTVSLLRGCRPPLASSFG